jgi:glycosyltransferase involved in cell wall biosynthesis
MPALSARKPSDIAVDVVIPVLNEAHVLAASVSRLRAYLLGELPYRWRIVIVDNGSTDGTDRVGRELNTRHQDVRYLRLDQRGRGRALRFAWSTSAADVVCYMDVDLSTELAALPKALTALTQEGYDIAVGSRLMPDSRTRRCAKREIISRIYNLMVKAVLFTRFSDAQCGFKVVTRTVVERIVPQIKDQSWFFDTEMLVLAEKQGYRIKDIPVIWNEDDDSRVKIIRTAWEDIKGVVRLRRLLWSRAFRMATAMNGKHAPTPVRPEVVPMPVGTYSEPSQRSAAAGQ